jgi:oxygen-independent coproporphyrinogen-3 oxidase
MSTDMVRPTVTPPVPTGPAAALTLDAALIRKYGSNGPRYTSYPTADRFVEGFGPRAYRRHLAQRSIGGLSRTLGLYLHVPFCDTLCFYCACNKIATRNHSAAREYVLDLEREIALVDNALRGDRRVAKMHWGGGTPTFLAHDDMARLVQRLRSTFDFNPNGEYAIEIDPRRAGPDRIAQLSALGFNRMSIGVQDFDADVQRAVNRVQSVESTAAVIDAGRRYGFRSINLDLIFGLPKQTAKGFEHTLEQVIACDPDRIALYAYAHLPAMFKPQRRIVEAELPSPDVKLALLALAIDRLDDAGYIYIGMDHFAKPTDELAIARKSGNLTRDFQGYSVGRQCDLVALGVSGISSIGPAYAQNVKQPDAYRTMLDQDTLPVQRGIELSYDDLLRRAVIQALSCQFEVAKESIGIAYLIDFDRYFAVELDELKAFADDGLVELEADRITVTPRGRMLVRAICMVFDRHLRAQRAPSRYSRVM